MKGEARKRGVVMVASRSTRGPRPALFLLLPPPPVPPPVFFFFFYRGA